MMKVELKVKSTRPFSSSLFVDTFKASEKEALIHFNVMTAAWDYYHCILNLKHEANRMSEDQRLTPQQRGLARRMHKFIDNEMSQLPYNPMVSL